MSSLWFSEHREKAIARAETARKLKDNEEFLAKFKDTFKHDLTSEHIVKAINLDNDFEEEANLENEVRSNIVSRARI